MRSIFIRLFLTIIIVSSSVLYGQNDFKTYNNARKLTYNRKWQEAINAYNSLIENYPASRYADDATFWIAFIFEKEDKLSDAFSKYQELIQSYPTSSWVDDAMIHQILLAEKFISEGKNGYTEFLINMLKNENENVCWQAAISLGKLGNKNALPILKEIQNKGDEDLSKLASALMDKVNKEPIVENMKTIANSRSDIEILIKAKREGGLSDETNSGFWDQMFYETNRYKIYKQLNKKGEKWTELELIAYGLWHVLPEEQFSEFFLLNNDYDKKEWLRKLWIRWDPTPTTPENERKDEFMRRIYHARNEFGKEWESLQSNFLRDQYLKPGWSLAPWDSRGELYIKYGEPDIRNIEGFVKEEWTYYRYNVDFIIKPYVTNIFGNGIEPGPLCNIMYAGNPAFIDANFIFRPEFMFDPYKGYDPLKSFKVNLTATKNSTNTVDVEVKYSFSGNELKTENMNNQFQAIFEQSYLIYNEDFKEILSNQEEIILTAQTKKEINRQKDFTITCSLNIPPGYYTLALRIKDKNSSKLGIFLKEFNIK